MVEFRFPVVAIAGENGAGKSTILKAAAAAYTAEQTSGYTFYPTTFFPIPHGRKLKASHSPIKSGEDKDRHADASQANKPLARYA
ncbi:AAA family ATPase [Streptomyces parvulus]|nr:AAA family ATPase [Streptomyces parvulus]